MVTTFYPPFHFGGDGVFVERLTQELAARGHSVDVIHNIDAYQKLGGKNTEVVREENPLVQVHGLRSRAGLLSLLAMHQSGSPAFASKEMRTLLDRDYDVIHFHNVSLMGAPEVLRYGSGAVKLYTMHEYWLVCPTHVMYKFEREACEQPECLRCTLQHRRPPQLWRYTDKLEEASRHVDAFLSPSQFVQRLHESRGFRGPMVDLGLFVPHPAAAVAKRGRGVTPYFLLVGRLESLKGFHTVIPLFEGTGPELWIAGEGSQRAELEQLAAGNQRIRFLGHVKEPQISELFRGALAVIVPSLTYETFGLVILEAFRQATPVVVRRLGALPEAVEASGAGFIYSDEAELRSILELLAGNLELRDELGGRGLAAFQDRWTPEAHLERYFSIIDGVAGKKG